MRSMRLARAQRRSHAAHARPLRALLRRCCPLPNFLFGNHRACMHRVPLIAAQRRLTYRGATALVAVDVTRPGAHCAASSVDSGSSARSAMHCAMGAGRRSSAGRYASSYTRTSRRALAAIAAARRPTVVAAGLADSCSLPLDRNSPAATRAPQTSTSAGMATRPPAPLLAVHALLHRPANAVLMLAGAERYAPGVPGLPETEGGLGCVGKDAADVTWQL